MAAGRSSRVRTPSRDVERALIDAAETVLVRDGLAGVTVRAVAAEAGVAPMGVYSRFGGKEGLERELLIRGFTGLAQAVEVDADLDPLDRVRESGLGYRRFAVEYPQHYQLMFRAASGVHFASEEVRESAARAFGTLVAHLAQARAQGIIADGDPNDLAQQVWSAIHGAVSLELTGSTRSSEPDQMYVRLLDLMIRGLKTPA